MTYKHLILGLAAGTAFLVATGCSKQESSATPSTDNATRSQAPMDSETRRPAPAPNASESQPPAAANKPELVATPNTAAASPAPGSVADQPVVKTPAASGSDATTTPAGSVRAQQLSLAQSGTNQLQALATSATNRALAALGTTNQAASMTTNQVQALLEQTKNLTSNQKYQEALGTLTQLYNTKLTPEQKQQADELKVQIQTAVTQKAASSLGNFLGGKK